MISSDWSIDMRVGTLVSSLTFQLFYYKMIYLTTNTRNIQTWTFIQYPELILSNDASLLLFP